MAVPGWPGQLLLAVLSLSLLSHHCTASPLPPSCKQEPAQQATNNCTYGRTVDSCGSPACLKGPGEMCGGKYGRSVAWSGSTGCGLTAELQLNILMLSCVFKVVCAGTGTALTGWCAPTATGARAAPSAPSSAGTTATASGEGGGSHAADSSITISPRPTTPNNSIAVS